MLRSKSVSTATAATLIATIVIIVLVGTYAGISFTSKNNDTSITCSESLATFTIIQYGNTTSLTHPIPAEPCEHQISLVGFSLTSTGSLVGNITVDSHSLLTGLILYVNGTYELSNPMGPDHETSYSIQFITVLSNATLPIVSGGSYTIEFVALFKDGTAATATTTINASA